MATMPMGTSKYHRAPDHMAGGMLAIGTPEHGSLLDCRARLAVIPTPKSFTQGILLVSLVLIGPIVMADNASGRIDAFGCRMGPAM